MGCHPVPLSRVFPFLACLVVIALVDRELNMLAQLSRYMGTFLQATDGVDHATSGHVCIQHTTGRSREEN